jgi:GTPase KRas protein
MLTVLDTACGIDLYPMHEKMYTDADGFLLFYSITDRTSFEEIKLYKEKISGLRNVILAGKLAHLFKHLPTPMILVGAKCDLQDQRQVYTTEGTELAGSWNIPFIEVSSKNTINIRETISQLVQLLRQAKVTVTLGTQTFKH